MFSYGTPYGTICTKHTSLRAAMRSALKCELEGGSHHKVLRVEEIQRPERMRKAA
jgi:hypothetical protein